MRQTLLLASIGLLAVVAENGCRAPAPRPVAVPPTRPVVISGPVHEHDQMKPLPPQRRASEIPPPYNDVPLVTQTPPEEPAFLDAYQRVGHPRLMILATPASNASQTGSIDYDAIETVLGDWMSCSGAVNLISPYVARSTSPEATTAPQPEADVLIRVQVYPPRNDVKEVRLIAEAVNTRGGESIGRAVVDVPTPLEKDRLNESTRFIARKLMDEMTQSWNQMIAEHPPTAAPQSAPAAPSPAAAPATMPDPSQRNSP